MSDSSRLIDWIGMYGDPASARSFGGIVPAYPIFMFIGIIVVIVAAITQMKLKKIPLRELELAIVIVVPIGILGATVFGKVFIPGMKWYKVFFFWEPGMSLFGALALGVTAGFVWFYKRSKVTMISVWVYADCILVHVLLGQAIGRWGNMYNHEILGKITNYDSLSWLIPSIRNQMFYFPTQLATLNLPSNWGQQIAENGINAANNWNLSANDLQTFKDSMNQTLDWRQPLFLYESLANFALWLILTFFVANLSRFFQKKGKYPWELDPMGYPGWYNKKNKYLVGDEITVVKTQKPIKYKQVHDKKTKEVLGLKISFFNAWKKAYYWSEVSDATQEELLGKQEETSLEEQKGKERLVQLKEQYHEGQKRLKTNTNNRLAKQTKKSDRYQEIQNDYRLEKKALKTSYQEKKKVTIQKLGGIGYYFGVNPNAKMLTKANNPQGFWILRSGVLSGGYVFGYLLIRIILETQRISQELFIQNHPVADFIVLGLILVSGLAIIGVAQFVSPYKYRDVGWLYEKSY